MDAKVLHEDQKIGLHDVRKFVRACNLHRCHIRNFTYTSAILTDQIKKSTIWRWGSQEQQAFDELKDKVSNANCLGMPRAQREIILVTDAPLTTSGSQYLWATEPGNGTRPRGTTPPMSRNCSRVCWCFPHKHDCWGVTLWCGCATESRSALSRRFPT